MNQKLNTKKLSILKNETTPSSLNFFRNGIINRPAFKNLKSRSGYPQSVELLEDHFLRLKTMKIIITENEETNFKSLAQAYLKI